MSNEEIEKEIELRAKEKETFAKAKAEAEAKEIAEIAQDTNKTIQTKINMQVANHIDTSQEVAEQIKHTADKFVKKGLATQENKIDTELKKSEKDKNKAEFDLEEDQYRAFGQEIAPSQEWKKKMIEIGNDFWFIVIFAICFVSLAPFYSFTKVIKTQSGILKFVAIATGVCMLLLIFGGLTYFVLTKTGVIH